MRFTTLQDAKQHMINNLGYADAQAVFDKTKHWTKQKRLMFSPSEFEALKDWAGGNGDLELARIHHLIDELEGSADIGLYIVIHASIVDQVNMAVKTRLDPIGGDKTFTIGLSKSGDPPAQAYWCHWNMPDSWAAHLYDYVQDKPKIHLYNDEAWTAQEVLDAEGLKIVVVQV